MTWEAFILRALAVPFVVGGRDYDEGWDCWGLCRAAYRDVLGIDLPSHDGYTHKTSFEEISRFIGGDAHGWDHVEQSRVGDVVLYRVGKHPAHIALMIDSRRALHANADVGTAIERLSSPLWHSRFEGFFRYAG